MRLCKKLRSLVKTSLAIQTIKISSMINNAATRLLCSGVALGVYVPGLVLFRQLKSLGLNIDIHVIEGLFSIEKRNKILENKYAFHRNFRLALIGQKMAGDMTQHLDNNLLNELFEEWHVAKVERFIIFSGYWLPVIDAYLKKYPFTEVKCDLCHMDAVESTSWSNYQYLDEKYQNNWFFSLSQNRVNYLLNIGNYKPVPFSDRHTKFVIHGGGWGMGTYSNYIPKLNSRNFHLDIVTYENEDLKVRNDKNRYFMIDPEWKSWEKNEKNEYVFPPIGKADGLNKPIFSSNIDYADIYDIERESLAIISKPGGGTLLDSISSATPVIFLEPFGKYEVKNSALWQNLGFGISYENWEKSNYSILPLNELHDNLLIARSKILDFADYYFKQLS